MIDMRNYLLLLLFSLFFLPSVFAYQNILINTTNDTFTSWYNSNCNLMTIGSYSGNQILNETNNYGNLTEVLYTLCCNTGFLSYAFADTRAFFKFSTNEINGIITDLRFNTGTTTRFNYGTNIHTNVYFSKNQTWNEYEITRQNEPVILGKILANDRFNLSDRQTPNILELGNTGTLEFLDALYSNDNITIVIKGSETKNVTCGASQVGFQVTASSRETDRSDNMAYLNVTMEDYVTGYIAINWGGWGNDNFYFDFESQTASSSQRGQDDFRLTRTGSILVTPNSVFPLGLVKSAIYNQYDYSDTNSLDITNCRDINLVYSTAQIPNLNNPIGTYWTICFNLSSEHNGKQYYGAIKIINNTNSYTSFYYAVYSPNYVTFSDLLFSPSYPKNQDNVSVEYTTTNLLTSGIIINSVIDGIAVPTKIYQNYTLNYYHNLVIPNITAGLYNATYCVKPFGYTENNITFIGNEKCFNVVPLDKFIYSRDKSFENYTDAVIIFPRDKKTGNTLPSACLISYPPCNLPTCSNVAEPCIVKNTTSPPCSSGENECWFYCSSGLSSCDYVNKQPCKYPISEAETLPLSSSPKLFYNGNYVNWNYIALMIGNNPFYYSPFYFNYSCFVSDEYESAKGSFKVYKPLPYYVNIYFDKKPTCIKTRIGMTSLYECERNMNLTGANAWYCSYDANACRSYNEKGECLSYGVYNGYECESCNAVPLNFKCNGTQAGNGTQILNPSDILCEGINKIFNKDCNSSLSFVALLVSLVLTAIVGFYSRNGIIAGLVLITSILMFYFIGWIPVWVIIILGVISAFLIAKFIVSAISPQGSGG